MLTLDEARACLTKFSNCATDDAVRAIVSIAELGRTQQGGWSRLRLEALRALGRFLIRHGRPAGRPAALPTAAQIAAAGELSAGHNLHSLADLGITNRNISADAKNVARVGHRVFDRYIRDEPEPTFAGLMRAATVHRNSWLRVQHPSASSRALSLDAASVSDEPGMSNPAMMKKFGIDAENSSVEWYTPNELYTALGVRFDTDVASPGKRMTPWIPASRFITIREDALSMSWARFGFVWMNSPYGRRHGIDDWIAKFVEHANGLAMVPDFTSTGWFHQLACGADAIMVLKPKVKFQSSRLYGGSSNSLGSTLVAYGERGVQALHNAERAGRGLVFARTAVTSEIELRAVDFLPIRSGLNS